MRPRSKTGPHGPGHSYWPALAPPTFPAVHNISFTRFSFGIGAGIRFYASRHLGFKIQAEWLPVLVDPHVAFICGSGCIVHAGGTASSQGEVLVGPILRF